MKACNKGMVIALCLLFLCVGYVTGVFVGWPNYENSLLSGDVGKAKKFKKEVALGDIAAVENKIRTDEQFRSQTLSSLAFINSRISEFNMDAQLSLSAVKELPEFNELSGNLELYIKKATNAQALSSKALNSLDELIKGKADNDYAQLANNSILAYMLLNDGVILAKTFVERADLYLKGKKVQDNSKLALSRDLWMKYCAVEAFLRDNKELHEYWGGKQYLLDPDAFASSFNKIANKEQLAVMCKALLLNNPLMLKVGASEKLSLGNNVKNLNYNDALGAGLNMSTFKSNENFIKLVLGNAQTLDQFVKSLSAGNSALLQICNTQQLKGISSNDRFALQQLYLSVGWGNLFNSSVMRLNLQTDLVKSASLDFI